MRLMLAGPGAGQGQGLGPGRGVLDPGWPQPPPLDGLELAAVPNHHITSLLTMPWLLDPGPAPRLQAKSARARGPQCRADPGAGGAGGGAGA